jgi:hypothetical protein
MTSDIHPNTAWSVVTRANPTMFRWVYIPNTMEFLILSSIGVSGAVYRPICIPQKLIDGISINLV